MTAFGIHANHERTSPRQGHSGFAWSWLGAALATTGLRVGVVTAPGSGETVSHRGPARDHAGSTG